MVILVTFNSSIEAVLIDIASVIFNVPNEPVPAKFTSPLELITPVTFNVPPIVVAPPTVSVFGVTSEPKEPVAEILELTLPLLSMVRAELVRAKAVSYTHLTLPTKRIV